MVCIYENAVKSFSRLDHNQYGANDKQSYYVWGHNSFIGKWLLHAIVGMKGNAKDSIVSIGSRKRGTPCCEATTNVRFVSLHEALNSQKLDSKSGSFVVIHSSTPTSTLSIEGCIELSSMTEKFYSKVSQNSEELTIIHLSSGAVYRRSRSEDSPFHEDDELKPLSECDAYSRAKLNIENLTNDFGRGSGNRSLNLRLFSFIGSGITPQHKFAVQDFLFQAISNNSVKVSGSLESKRSYMHPLDLFQAIYQMNIARSSGAFNVGSFAPVTMQGLIETISKVLKKNIVIEELLSEGPNYYYPDVSKLAREVSYEPYFDLELMLKEYLGVGI